MIKVYVLTPVILVTIGEPQTLPFATRNTEIGYVAPDTPIVADIVNFTPCSTVAGAVTLNVVIETFENMKAFVAGMIVINNRRTNGRIRIHLTDIPSS